MRTVTTLAMLGSTLAFGSVAHAERHYDCTKAGNANKACKVAAAPAPAAPTKAVAVTDAKTARHYDCSKPGNASKVVCKGEAVPTTVVGGNGTPAERVAPPAPGKAIVTPVAAPDTSSPSAGGSHRIITWTEKNGKVVHYDCSKAGNLTKQACKK